MRGEARAAFRGYGATARCKACNSNLVHWGAGHGEERTSSIQRMLVTLVVSKLSG